MIDTVWDKDRVKKISRTLNINLTLKHKKITAWESWRVWMAVCWRPLWIWKRAGLGPYEQEGMWRSEAFELEEYSWWWGMSGHLFILLSGGGVCWFYCRIPFLEHEQSHLLCVKCIKQWMSSIHRQLPPNESIIFFFSTKVQKYLFTCTWKGTIFGNCCILHFPWMPYM